MIPKLKHRGPDSQTICIDKNIAIGFQRLEINGDEFDGRQPFELQGWISVTNGEIYNYQALAKKHQLNANNCDTKIILPLYLKLKEQIVEKLDGFYSAVLINPTRSKAICLRDAMGKKPLFVGVSNGMTFISSELKPFDSIEWFKPLPKGVSVVELSTGEVTELYKQSSKIGNCNIVDALTYSIRKRLPSLNQPVAVFLSGGLDSSIIASITSKVRGDVVYFTLSDTTSNDYVAARTVAHYLNLKNLIVVPLPSDDELPHLINRIVYATESFNPSIVSNGLATYLLARAAQNLCIKVVLTGEGADELFGGYHQFSDRDPWSETRERLIQDMTFTELRRLDLACMANGIEPRCPFLDPVVKSLSDRMSFSELYADDINKMVLRKAFKGALPQEIIYRKKISCDVGSGIRTMVVRYLKRNGRSEREELLTIWKQYFNFDPTQSYFHSYPVFDVAIDARGEVHR
ncbi:asparagine synthetase B family protein [Paraglaciecola sp. 2405UD69-4]|uniref:asparagine synthetase B family protein n=1 Tax=Paraglaciecola sp. 2405UD69-4 TaxID=3391836 RepID=UPI0039C9CA05